MRNRNLKRRDLLKGLGAALAVTSTGGLVAGCARPARPAHPASNAVVWSAGEERSTLKLPANATDCHHHIYDHRYPWAPEATLKPGDATVKDYRRLQARLGTTRNVIIQPSSYGVDNSLLVASIAQFGGRARGVAVVNTGVTDRELRALHEAGVRGIRFNLNPPGTTTLHMVRPLARRVAPMGWHVQVSAPASDLLMARDTWSSSPCPIVFDHLATIPEPDGLHHPCFQMVADLLVAKLAYVKLTGFYVTSRVGAPSYRDSVDVAAAFANKTPERVLWGSDWPHPSEQPKHAIPDDAALLDLFSVVVPDAATRDRILVDNPAALYQFS